MITLTVLFNITLSLGEDIEDLASPEDDRLFSLITLVVVDEVDDVEFGGSIFVREFPSPSFLLGPSFMIMLLVDESLFELDVEEPNLMVFF